MSVHDTQNVRPLQNLYFHIPHKSLELGLNILYIWKGCQLLNKLDQHLQLEVFVNVKSFR